ncbi:DUF2309 domain-containing protein [Rhodanobacter sp. AS-Z3]|uniref:YbcC family protein n=1 Tax=Rhodanobacter sp. AS-Z3 TaxID=3031330 RepID=UPI002479B389|nr:DUF2309 domain-containing protein [Rhodanobacter sp. AS-Z3]WEN15701.1 DUF2309 domain-containing protein [Rhodanobacter sp. AS-Z3]
MNATALKLHETDATVLPALAPAANVARDAAERAGRRLAPLWPLKHFVAVNPFLGLTDHTFVDAARVMGQAAGAQMTMPRAFYLDAIAEGRISERDIAEALQRADGTTTSLYDLAAFRRELRSVPTPVPEAHPTVADAASRATGYDWAELASERISLWAASHFDEGQAPWLSPSRHLGPYAAWRQDALLDRTPQVMGLAGFCRSVQALPETAEAMISVGVARLQISESGLTAYFHRLLMSVSGWAGYARYRVWQSELRQRSDNTLLELLAVRLAWDVAILDALRGDDAVVSAWQQARRQYDVTPTVDRGLALDHLLQSAYEIAWQRGFIATLGQARAPITTQRKAVQAAFCIDVRSEVFRRALESASPDVDTIGFAGFFGMPIEFVPLGRTHGGAQCPVLLAPTITVREQVKAASPQQTTDIVALRQLRLRGAAAWRWFKLAAVSSFAYVEAMGWIYAGKLLTDSFGFTRPVPPPKTDGLDADVAARRVPGIEPEFLGSVATGLALDTRVKLAEGALKAMSLRADFARLVLFAGHGASSINNPHASGLDCGACGGHSGEANARVAAAVLNDPRVRRELGRRGITIPADTWFIGALHNTTTDQLTIFDQDQLPATHADDLARLQSWLAAAGERARLERAGSLNLRRGQSIDDQIMARSADWSQVRPEWGLAGCAAYIVAPRQRTAGLDLAGRAFLNSYDWQQDEGFAVLESIMTAPMVVGAWINLQYYASAVDNRVFGCGNKVLHNVVGKLGVLEGTGGDLRTGLPWQSVHDGERLIHEPLRMAVFIAAPVAAINAIIAKHESVRQLVDHGWVHLFALAEASLPMQRYRGALQWENAA